MFEKLETYFTEIYQIKLYGYKFMVNIYPARAIERSSKLESFLESKCISNSLSKTYNLFLSAKIRKSGMNCSILRILNSLSVCTIS